MSHWTKFKSFLAQLEEFCNRNGYTINRLYLSFDQPILHVLTAEGGMGVVKMWNNAVTFVATSKKEVKCKS